MRRSLRAGVTCIEHAHLVGSTRPAAREYERLAVLQEYVVGVRLRD